jgi:uncharacterized protein (DUF3084 family)
MKIQMVDDDIIKRYGGKIIRKKIPLSQEVRKTIVALLFGLILITVALSIVFLLNTSNSAQKGYIHSQLRLKNEELENLNKELRKKVIEAKSMLHLEETDKIDEMVKPEKNTYIAP